MTEVTVQEQTKACQRMTQPEKRVSKKELQNFEIVERTPRQLVLWKILTLMSTVEDAIVIAETSETTTVENNPEAAGKSPTVEDVNRANAAEEIENATETEVRATTADEKVIARKANLTAVDIETAATELRTVNGKLEPHETVEEMHLTL